MTLQTGKTPLTHHVRHSFSAAEDLRPDPDSLPVLLKAQGYTVGTLADFAGDFFSRLAQRGDMTVAPRLDVRTVLRQRVLKSHVHFLPYASRRSLRSFFPALRTMPELADPMDLAWDADGMLKRLRFRKKFLLTVYFSSLREPTAVSGSSYRAFMNTGYRGTFKYEAPLSVDKPESVSAEDRYRRRRLYAANVRRLDEAVGRILNALKKYQLDENTLIVFAAPCGEDFYEQDFGRGHGRHLYGNAALLTPFFYLEPRQQTAARWISEPVRLHDVVPTVLDLLGLPVPETMEGFPLTRREFGLPPDEFFLAYSETGLWWTPEEPRARLPYPGIRSLLVVDPSSSQRFCLNPAWEDRVLLAKHRMIQLGSERLVYVPTPRGVRFELYDFSVDPQGIKDLAQTPSGRARVVELKEIFYRYLARERGWRPQNEYWIPEAFLREEE